jgi:hypothetical protein
MNPSSLPLVLHRAPRWRWVGLLAGVVGGLSAQDWQPLLSNSPFGQVTAAAAAVPGELEFRGVVQEEGAYFVNLFNPTTKTSQWVAVNGQAPGVEVKSYDATAEKVQVTLGGRALSLPLKQAKVTLAKVAVPPPPSEGGDKGDDRKGEFRDMIRARLEAAGGDPAQVMRNLPPEAQAMMEEFRRRRAERAEGGEGGSGKTAGKSEKSGSSKNAPSSEAPLRTRRQP